MSSVYVRLYMTSIKMITIGLKSFLFTPPPPPVLHTENSDHTGTARLSAITQNPPTDMSLTPSRTDRGLQEARPDATVLAHRQGHLADIGSSGLAHRRHGVNGWDPLRQKRVRHLRGAPRENVTWLYTSVSAGGHNVCRWKGHLGRPPPQTSAPFSFTF